VRADDESGDVPRRAGDLGIADLVQVHDVGAPRERLADPPLGRRVEIEQVW